MEDGPLRKKRVITDGAAGIISRVEELAYELTIEEVMTRELKTVAPGDKMEEVLELLRQSRISGAPVVMNGELVGIVSLEDLIRALRHYNMGAPVSEYMTRQVITVRTYHPVIEALKIFQQSRVGRLPVLDDDEKLVGIITKTNITSGVLKSLENDYREEEVRRYRARNNRLA